MSLMPKREREAELTQYFQDQEAWLGVHIHVDTNASVLGLAFRNLGRLRLLSILTGE